MNGARKSEAIDVWFDALNYYLLITLHCMSSPSILLFSSYTIFPIRTTAYSIRTTKTNSCVQYVHTHAEQQLIHTHTHTHTHTRTFFSKCICMHACLYAVVVQDLQYVTPIHQYQYWYDITFTHIHSNVFLRVYVPLPIGLGFCLYKAGYENITNIDISPSIILQMTHLMQKGRERGRDRGSVESIGPCNVDCKSP